MAEKEFTKGAKRVLDEGDEYVAGFMSLQIIDQDGYTKKTKGSAIESPWHLRKDGDNYVLHSVFPANHIFHQCIPSEPDHFLYGKWWLGEKAGKTTDIAELVEKDCPGIHKQLDGDKKDFEVEVRIPFLPDSNKKENMVMAKFVTKEQRFVTKVTDCYLTIPKAQWEGWKSYRLKLWRLNKAWGADDKDDKEEKDEKKEGEEEKK